MHKEQYRYLHCGHNQRATYIPTYTRVLRPGAGGRHPTPPRTTASSKTFCRGTMGRFSLRPRETLTCVLISCSHQPAPAQQRPDHRPLHHIPVERGSRHA